MRSRIAMMALAGCLTATIVLAQVPAPAPRTNVPTSPPTRAAAGPRPVGSIPTLSPAPAAGSPVNGTPAAGLPDPNAATAARAPRDERVFEASTALPAPTIPDQETAPSIPLPTDPIEPYLLTRNAGPFMVMAKTFRGPDSDRWALALVLELRNKHGLPAYILRSRDFPMRSNIRNIPPTAIREIQKPYIAEPEKTRTYDEAMVLVGDAKTLKESEELLHVVKKIKPDCLNGMTSIFHWRKGLHTAMRTTNPFVPAQDLFPKKPDVFVKKLNSGPHSILQCPGQFTMQVAEFGGRSSFNTEDPKFLESKLGESNLWKAYDDAEKLADTLAKNPEIQKTGQQPYVYHDRTSSKVMVGAFNAPNDPAAVKVRETLLKLAVPMMRTEKDTLSLLKKKTDVMIAPAPSLTDVAVLKTKAQ